MHHESRAPTFSGNQKDPSALDRAMKKILSEFLNEIGDRAVASLIPGHSYNQIQGTLGLGFQTDPFVSNVHDFSMCAVLLTSSLACSSAPLCEPLVVKRRCQHGALVRAHTYACRQFSRFPFLHSLRNLLYRSLTVCISLRIQEGAWDSSSGEP